MGIESCPGPTITKLPLRIRLPSATTSEFSLDLQTVAGLVRKELVHIMPHEQSALAALSRQFQSRKKSEGGEQMELLHAGTLIGEQLPLDLVVHHAGSLDNIFNAGEGFGMRHESSHTMTPPPGGFVAECYVLPRDGMAKGVTLNVTAIWDNRAAQKREVAVRAGKKPQKLANAYTLEKIFYILNY